MTDMAVPAPETAVAPPPGRRHERPRVDRVGYLFVAFFSVPFFLFNILPVLFGVYVAFTRWSIVGSPRWVGTENFTRAFADPWVTVAFQNALIYGVLIVPGVTVLGLAFALFVSRGYPLSGLARTLFFAPNVVSATVIGLVWVWLLDTQFGLVNHYLGVVGVSAVPWLTSTDWSLVGVSIASVWWDLGLAFVLFLAALQDIPADLTEAALVDGAGRWQRLFFIVLPQLRPVISMVVTLQLISTFRIFSQVYVMTNGGPAGSSSSPIYYIYTMAIVRNLFGYASAIALLLFIVILVITLLQRFLLKERA
ncbi:multiple sugar transport system permease protein [Angulomicrobium tetraedrale]|uniref:Multiple sugar transport system permease protein n=1 Tax=Ancylobacter tetraedralis TaxID=217068 RepID=A0A839ZFA5_9HYPH|nr:sugar ABC transporter permease [Ancylobacter tetraedralis]MBB3773449.1 multiple sugar transport system permease protein [Ancylobacter tetraedralis]